MFSFSKIKRAFETVKDPQVLVAEIHNEFDTATERLLNEAKDILSKGDKVKQDKAQRLKSLGFSQAKPVISTQKQLEDEKKSKEVADAIMYYQQWYPNNKFITDQEVEKICKKYSLVCGEVGYYTGDVPEKNLSEIESFKLRDEEKISRSNYDDYFDNQRMRSFMQSQRRAFGIGDIGEHMQPRYDNKPTEYVERLVTPSLKICAPVKDFDTTRMRVEEGYKLKEIPDPIVLQPIKNGYLIISKWGLEGEDESLVNEKMN